MASLIIDYTIYLRNSFAILIIHDALTQSEIYLFCKEREKNLKKLNYFKTDWFFLDSKSHEILSTWSV